MHALRNLAVAGVVAFAALLGPSSRADEAGRPPASEPSPAESSATGYTWTAVLDNRQVQPILGKEVRSPAGENMGRIVDVIVDGSGQPRAAVIDFGGFLGVGSRKIVVDWSAIHFAPDGDDQQITVNLTRDQLKAAPEFRSGKPVVVMGALSPAGPEM